MTPHRLSAMRLSPLRTISPSRFTGLEACALREVWSAGGQPGLLPVSPQARLGSVIHRVLEQAWKGGVPPGQEAAVWGDELARINAQLTASWLEAHLAPLQNTLPDHGAKRARCLERLRSLVAPGQGQNHASRYLIGAEVNVWDGAREEDSVVFGKIDLLLRYEDGYEIVDEKTGAVLDETGQVKEEYQTQLRLYAALAQRRRGDWPKRLTLRDLRGKTFDVPYTSKQAETLLATARQRLQEVNALVPQGEAALARPAPATCRFCTYRPACAAYWAARSSPEKWPCDVRGMITDAPFNQRNGHLRLVVEAGGSEVAISNIARCPDPANLTPGTSVALYSLAEERAHLPPWKSFPDRYRATRDTTVYLPEVGGRGTSE